MTEDELRHLTPAERAAWARWQATGSAPWCKCEGTHRSTKADRRFTAWAHEDLPAALAEIARLRVALTIIRDDCLDAVRESHMWRVATASALDIARDALTPPPASAPIGESI